jgi:hypothetical protein
MNRDGGWLHYIEDTGLELYIAKKPIRYNVSWEQLNARGLSLGGAEVTIGGEVFVVRLLSGAINPAGSAGPSNAGGEWNRYMYNIYTMTDRATFPGDAQHWGDYTGPMLGVATMDGSAELGVGTICSDGAAFGHFTRGSDSGGQETAAQVKGIWYISPDTPQNWYGWRPVLVKKSTMPPIPFIGEILAANFITGSALAAAVGLTDGTLVNDTTPWLKFVDNGSTFYMPKKIIRMTLSWAQLNALGMIMGTKTVVIGGLTYRVRVMTGGDGNDPTNSPGGEYNNYFMRVTNAYTGAGAAWAYNTPADMGWLGGISSGEMIICKEGSTQGGTLLRGYPGFAGVWYEPNDTPNVAYGWRPVLEELFNFSGMTWKSTASPGYSFHHDVVSYDGKLYWIGGFSGTPQAWFRRFDGTAWVDLPALPTARAGHTSAVVGSKLYVCGGLTANGGAATTLVECYDFTLGTWSTKAALPGPMTFGDGCVVGTNIYMFGGMTSSTVSPEVPTKFNQYKYDTLNNTWTELTITGQTPRLDLGVAAIGTKIYLIGGRNNSVYINKTFCYDTVTGVMTEKANMPAAYGCRRTFHSFKGRVISLWGSVNGGAPYSGSNVYDPFSNTWQALAANAGAARGFGGSGILGTRMFYFAGIKSGTGQTDSFEFSLPA